MAQHGTNREPPDDDVPVLVTRIPSGGSMVLPSDGSAALPSSLPPAGSSGTWLLPKKVEPMSPPPPI